jgi:hypothetical protein
METNEMLIFVGGGALFLKFLIYDPIISFWEKNPSPFKILIAILNNSIFQTIIGILLFIGFTVLFIKHKINVYRRNMKLRIKQEGLEREARQLRKWIEGDIKYLRSNELKLFIEKFDELYLSEETENKFDVEIKNKLILANNYLEKSLHEEELRKFNYQKENLESEISKLRNKRFEEEEKSSNKQEIISERLNIEENLIYESENLSLQEIEVLEKEGFKEVCEYDPIHEENTKFLVKQILNHSPTHTFLVARIGELLNQYGDITKVYFHNTKDADITFEVNYKIYAFEIERGSLLTKKKNLRNKISLLNNKYGQNWYFIVTNRNLAKKYRKYGKVTSRMGVRKIIEKLIGN